MRTCFIHIGTHKTGTTSIQGTLNNNRQALERHGILYPRAGIPPTLAGHHNIAEQLLGDSGFYSEHGSIDDLLVELRDSEHNVVISSEQFEIAVHDRHAFETFIRRLKQHTPRIVIIVYFRNQAGYARSLYLELLKHGYPETFDTFLTMVLRDRLVRLGSRLKYPFCYRDFLQFLPPENEVKLVVRHYDRTRPGSVVSDFLSILGLSPNDLGIEAELRENPEVPLADAFLSFYESWRGRPFGPSESWLIPIIRNALDGKHAGLTDLAEQQVVAAYDQSNQFINARFRDCALATLATAVPDTSSGRRFHIEHIFSEATAHLIGEIADKSAPMIAR